MSNVCVININDAGCSAPAHMFVRVVNDVMCVVEALKRLICEITLMFHERECLLMCEPRQGTFQAHEHFQHLIVNSNNAMEHS